MRKAYPGGVDLFDLHPFDYGSFGGEDTVDDGATL
jgi:hypothetical protein